MSVQVQALQDRVPGPSLSHTRRAAAPDKPGEFPCLVNLPPTNLGWPVSLVSPCLSLCMGASL